MHDFFEVFQLAKLEEIEIS